jgi:hypothetical protein
MITKESLSQGKDTMETYRIHISHKIKEINMLLLNSREKEEEHWDQILLSSLYLLASTRNPLESRH